MRSTRGTPVYKFNWSSPGEAEGKKSRDDSTTRPEWENDSRRTDDEDAFETDEPHPDAVMALAALGRQDPDCEVTVIGMEN